MNRTSNFYNRKHRDSDCLNWDTQIQKATKAVYQKLSALDYNNLGISDYNNKYLNEHLSDFEKTSWFISHIFMLVFEKGKKADSSVFIDYGGGSGIISYVALELGFKDVIYNDIFQISCDDVAIISNSMGFKLNHIVCGDVNNLNAYISEKKISIDFIVSQDVIEHIYDVKQWYTDLNSMINQNTTVICTSHANLYNPLIAEKLMKLQKNLELKDREKQWGAKERDSLKGFLSLRKEIILEYNPSLNKEETQKLANATRGLIKKDIYTVVDDFRKDKTIRIKPNHKTNTCDPITGNWSEQLIDLKNLKSFLESNQYSTNISSGFYIDSKGSNMVRLIKKIVNQLIYCSRFNGLYLAPYYVIETNRKNKN